MTLRVTRHGWSPLYSYGEMMTSKCSTRSISPPCIIFLTSSQLWRSLVSFRYRMGLTSRVTEVMTPIVPILTTTALKSS